MSISLTVQLNLFTELPFWFLFPYLFRCYCLFARFLLWCKNTDYFLEYWPCQLESLFWDLIYLLENTRKKPFQLFSKGSKNCSYVKYKCIFVK